MRDLVIQTILLYLRRGNNELGLKLLSYERMLEHKPMFYLGDFDFDSDIPIEQIKDILYHLSNKELLRVLDAQACQRYR